MFEEYALFTDYNPALLERSRRLRRDMTRHERHLWYDFLKEYPINVYKQRSMNRFIIDFYCPAAKLAIELDGGQHYTDEGEEYDSERTAVLKGYGVKVLRFSNFDVDNNFEGVCYTVDKEIRKRIAELENQ